MNALRIRRESNGLIVIGDAPGGSPTVDAVVLEVAGGHLEWRVTDLDAAPSAVLDDLPAAQQWIWAVYGAELAVALDRDVAESACAPVQPDLLVDARRLGYARWAQRWWPASTVDAIAPLDAGLLDAEIDELQARCDGLLDPDWLHSPETTAQQSISRDDYALAAGPASAAAPGTLVLARGTGGTDWRRHPPGLLDASEQAVSWELLRLGGRTSALVRAAAAPGLTGPVPEHLWPWAELSGTSIPLDLIADEWFGMAELPSVPADLDVRIAVPWFGDDAPDLGGAELRERVRTFARARLRAAAAGSGDPLRAEIAAATDDA